MIPQARESLNREVTDSDRRAFAVLTAAGKAAFDQAEQPFLAAYYTGFAISHPKADVESFGPGLVAEPTTRDRQCNSWTPPSNELRLTHVERAQTIGETRSDQGDAPDLVGGQCRLRQSRVSATPLLFDAHG